MRDASGAFWTMCRCGQPIAPADENWREYAGHGVAAAGDVGLRLIVHESLEVRCYSCRECGRLHAVDVCRRESSDPYDIRLDTNTLIVR
jgi:N-methylhydantoinase B